MNNYLLHNYNPEKQKTWKSAYEIQAAALEHEKWRYYNIDIEPQTSLNRMLKFPLHLISQLFNN